METYTITYHAYGDEPIKFITKSPNQIHAIGKAYNEAQKGRDTHIFFKVIEIKKGDIIIYPKPKEIKLPNRFVVYHAQSTLIYYKEHNQYRRILNQFRPIKHNENKRISKIEYEKAYKSTL